MIEQIMAQRVFRFLWNFTQPHVLMGFHHDRLMFVSYTPSPCEHTVNGANLKANVNFEMPSAGSDRCMAHPHPHTRSISITYQPGVLRDHAIGKQQCDQSLEAQHRV